MTPQEEKNLIDSLCLEFPGSVEAEDYYTQLVRIFSNFPFPASTKMGLALFAVIAEDEIFTLDGRLLAKIDFGSHDEIGVFLAHFMNELGYTDLEWKVMYPAFLSQIWEERTQLEAWLRKKKLLRPSVDDPGHE